MSLRRRRASWPKLGECSDTQRAQVLIATAALNDAELLAALAGEVAHCRPGEVRACLVQLATAAGALARTGDRIRAEAFSDLTGVS